jgi:hypothetical protein
MTDGQRAAREPRDTAAERADDMHHMTTEQLVEFRRLLSELDQGDGQPVAS